MIFRNYKKPELTELATIKHNVNLLLAMIVATTLLSGCGSDSETVSNTLPQSGVITEIGSATVGLPLPRAINIGSAKTGANNISAMAVTDEGTDYSIDGICQRGVVPNG